MTMKGCLKTPSTCPTLGKDNHSPSSPFYANSNSSASYFASSETNGGRSTPMHQRKCVAFGAEGTEQIFTADEWDRTPTEPATKLTYQDLLELKEIQRSLPRANQPQDLISGRPSRHYLSTVPIGLLPLLADTNASPQSVESDINSSSYSRPLRDTSPVRAQASFPFPQTPSPISSTVKSSSSSSSSSSESNVSPWAINFQRQKPSFPTSPLSNSSHTSTNVPASALFSRPNPGTSSPLSPTPASARNSSSGFVGFGYRSPTTPTTPAHLKHLAPTRPPLPRQKPAFAFLPLLESPVTSPTPEPESVAPAHTSSIGFSGVSKTSITASNPHELDTDTDTDTEPPLTPSLTSVSLDSTSSSSSNSSVYDSSTSTSTASSPYSSRPSSCEPGDRMFDDDDNDNVKAYRSNTLAMSMSMSMLDFPTSSSLSLSSSSQKEGYTKLFPRGLPSFGVHDTTCTSGAVIVNGIQTPQLKAALDVGDGNGELALPSPLVLDSDDCNVGDGKKQKKERQREKKKRNVIIVNDMEIELDDDDDDDDDGSNDGEEENDNEKALEDTALSIPQLQSPSTSTTLMSGSATTTSNGATSNHNNNPDMHLSIRFKRTATA